MSSTDQPDPSALLLAAVTADDWDGVHAVLDRSWLELFHKAPEALLVALEKMPDAVIDREPKLRLAREYIARNLRGDDHSTAYRNSADSVVPVDTVDRLAILTGEIAAARSDGRADEVLSLVDAAHELLDAQPVQRGPELAGALPELHYQWGLALERAGHLDRAVADYNDSFDWAVSIGHRMMQVASAGAIAYLHALHGRIGAAEKWLGKQPPPEEDAWWTPTTAVQARMARALVAASVIDPDHDPSPLEGIDVHQVVEHWAPLFFTRAMSIRSARPARLLRMELDGFLATLPAGQIRGDASAEYLDTIRLLLGAWSQDSSALESDDRPTAGASFLRQFSAAIRAVRSAREGRRRFALTLAAPLLHVDGSRPRVIVLASLASAIATENPKRRSAFLEEAVLLAHAQGYDSTFIALPDDLREEAAASFEKIGAPDTAARLREHVPMAAGVTSSVLTKRERAVVEHAVAGETSARIADTLRVSQNTVKSQIRSAYRKLGVSSRSELIETYRRPDAE